MHFGSFEEKGGRKEEDTTELLDLVRGLESERVNKCEP